jgi:hypothetical protein
LGVSYSVTKSDRNILRVSWGRIHDLIYNQAAPSFGARAPEIRDEWDNNLDGVFETVRVTPSIGLSGPPRIQDRLVDPDLSPSHVDELQFGFTHQLPRKLVLDLAYINRSYRNAIGALDSNIIFENGEFRGYRNPSFDAILLTTNLRNASLRYQSFEFSLTRNFGSRFQTFCSYTYQKQAETGGFKYDDITGYLNPRAWFKNDRLARPHILRLNGSVDLPWRSSAAAIFSLQSGEYSGPIVLDLNAADPEVAAHGPRTYTLSNGRIVNNPLYTARRLAGPRDEGQLRLEAIPRLNLRFGKAIRLRENQTLEFNLDLFNLTNNATPLFFRPGANILSTTLYGQVQSIVQSPRGAQALIRYKF